MNNNMIQKVKARQVQKHDSTENWRKAGENGFIPQNGEIIVYNADEENEVRMKIGDGKTNINNLPFMGGSGVSPDGPGKEAVYVSYEPPTNDDAQLWMNPNGSNDESPSQLSQHSIARIVGLVLNEAISNSAKRYATIQDALTGTSATADGRVLAYTLGGELNIMLLDNIASDTTINVANDCTIHLNGKVLSLTAAGAHLNITATGKVIINGEVAGSEITKNITNGVQERLVLATDTTLEILGGIYSMYGSYNTVALPIATGNENAKLQMTGCTVIANVTANYIYAVYPKGMCMIDNCHIQVYSTNIKTGVGIQAQSGTVPMLRKTTIEVVCTNEGAESFGIIFDKGDNMLENCRIEVDGHSDIIDAETNVATVKSAVAISARKNATLTINGGYFFGAREAISGGATTRINGGVYDGCQHGGAYFSGTDVMIKNAIFRNVKYTGVCGWKNSHFGAVYCGGGSADGANVSFDNCQFKSDTSLHGLVAKYSNTKVYLSDCVFNGNFTENDIRVDTGNTVFVGKNNTYNRDAVAVGGTFDTMTYADQDFGFETEATIPNALLSVKDECGNWVGVS